jgi:hypothetical protein
MSPFLFARAEHSRRMLKMAVQRGRSERRPEAYPQGYVEDLSDARTKLADFFSILLERLVRPVAIRRSLGLLALAQGDFFLFIY